MKEILAKYINRFIDREAIRTSKEATYTETDDDPIIDEAIWWDTIANEPDPSESPEWEGWLGHTHQSAYEQFTLGPVERTAIVGGTYKERDDWAAKRGIGGRGGMPGICIMLWPDGKEKHVQVFKDIETVQQIMGAMVFEEESRI